MTEYSIQTLMEKLINSFQPEKAAGIDATVQFHLSGEQGGDWYATVRDQKLVVTPGTTPSPNLLLSADTKDVLDVVGGRLNPMQAYMQGKVQFKGDIGLAMKLMNLFKKPG